MSQKPAFILNIEAPPGAFDINLSPDKREVVFAKQKEIIGDTPAVLSLHSSRVLIDSGYPLHSQRLYKKLLNKHLSPVETHSKCQLPQ